MLLSGCNLFYYIVKIVVTLLIFLGEYQNILF